MLSFSRVSPLYAFAVALGGCWTLAPVASVEAENLLRIDGSRGDYIGAGVVRDFTDADGTFGFELQNHHTLVFQFKGEGNLWYSLWFEAPEGQSLAPGNYELAERGMDDSPLRPSFDAGTFGKSCSASAGRFVIRELVRDPVTDLVTSFAADMEHRCGGPSFPPLFAEVRYQSSVPLDVPAPTAAAGADQIALERQHVVLDGTATMPGASATITEWHWRQVLGTPVTLDGTDTSKATFTAPAVTAPGESLQFELRTVNSAGLSSSDVVDVYVQNKTSPRSVAFLIGDGTIGDLPQNQKLTLLPQDGLFEAIDDPQGPRVAHLRWRGTGLNWYFNIITDARITAGHYDVNTDFGNPFISVESNAVRCSRIHGYYDILEIRYDGDHITGLALNFEQYCESLPVPTRGKVRFNVAMPDANAGPDLQAEGRSSVALTAAASQPAVGSISAYQWRQIAGPAVTLQGAALSNASFSAPDVTTETSLSFEVTVTDDRGIDDSDIVNVKVTPATPLPPPPPPPTGGSGSGGGGGGGAADWPSIALLALLGAWARRRTCARRPLVGHYVHKTR